MRIRVVCLPMAVALIAGALLLAAKESIGAQVPGDITYYAIEQKIADLKLAAVSVEWLTLHNERKSAGSGCLVKTPGGAGVLTCAHVISGIPKGSRLLVGLNTSYGKMYFQGLPTKADATLDLALLAIGAPDTAAGTVALLKRVPADSLKLNQVAISSSTYGDSTDFPEGRGVIMIG